MNLTMAVIILTHCAANSRVGVKTNAQVAASALCFFLAYVHTVACPPPLCRIRSIIGSKKAAVFPPARIQPDTRRTMLKYHVPKPI